MPEMNLRQPAFTYSACGTFTYNACETFTKNKAEFKKIKETEDSRYINQNKPDIDCFKHDKAYGNLKHLPSRTTSDQILREKAFNIARNPKYDGYQRGH